jgi:hypothetical protein
MNELANIEGEEIVIRIPFSAIPDAALVAFDEQYGFEQHDISVVDTAAFAKELRCELSRESEDGTTLVHLMLDKACVNAAENGAFGLSEAAAAGAASASDTRDHAANEKSMGAGEDYVK